MWPSSRSPRPSIPEAFYATTRHRRPVHWLHERTRRMVDLDRLRRSDRGTAWSHSPCSCARRSPADGIQSLACRESARDPHRSIRFEIRRGMGPAMEPPCEDPGLGVRARSPARGVGAALRTTRSLPSHRDSTSRHGCMDGVLCRAHPIDPSSARHASHCSRRCHCRGSRPPCMPGLLPAAWCRLATQRADDVPSQDREENAGNGDKRSRDRPELNLRHIDDAHCVAQGVRHVSQRHGDA